MNKSEAYYKELLNRKESYQGDELFMTFVANPKKPCMPKIKKINGTHYSDVARYNEAKEIYFRTYPELSLCQNSNITCPDLFHDVGQLCAKTYQSYGLLEKGKNFSEDPDIYCIVWKEGRIVGTLGYCYHDLPIRKTYANLEIENNAHELMRLTIDHKLGYSVEILSEEIIRMRQEEHKWQNAEKAMGYRFKKVNIATEVAKILFNGMLFFYRTLVKNGYYEEPPPLWISTHNSIIKFYGKVLGKNIFQEDEGGEINWSGIPKKSHTAYKRFKFRPYKIKLWELLPRHYKKELKKEKNWDIDNFIFDISTKKLPHQDRAVV